jgi:hypothetical protein
MTDEFVIRFDFAADPSEGIAATTIYSGWAGDSLEIGTANARSADAAIREVVGKQPENERGGQFVAIPARSFKPVTVSEKVERTLVIGS